MLRATPCCWTRLTKAVLVNWLPWSVLRIAGQPCARMAASRASRQQSAVIVLERRQARTRRVAQSSTATRYRKPRRMGIYVRSMAQTWFGRVIARSRSRYGNTRCPGWGRVVRGCR
jgi:hypothetical protein